MAQLLGIDLGARSVTVAVATPGFRQPTIDNIIERDIPVGDEDSPQDYLDKATQTLAQLMTENGLLAATPYVAVGGDALFIHVLEFPFKQLRRAELDKVVEGELDDRLPADVDDLVYTFERIREPAGARVQSADQLEFDDAPTVVQAAPRANPVGGRVAPPTSGMRVLAVAMPLEKAQALVDTMAAHRADPRALVAAPASYARIAKLITGDDDRTLALVDIGDKSIDVTVTQAGDVMFARTIARGGGDVIDAIVRKHQVPVAQAESALDTHGFISSSAGVASTPEQQELANIMQPVITTWARDLRQTLAAASAKTGAQVGDVVLVGRPSRIRGLASFLSERVGVSVRTLTPADEQAIVGEDLATRGVRADSCCLAVGVALEGGAGRTSFDLRQGPLAQKADLSFLRAKAGYLAAAALVVLAFVTVNGFAALYKLRTAEENLDKRCQIELLREYGEAGEGKTCSDLEDLTGSVAGDDGDDDSPVPQMDAYDVLLDVNSRLPEKAAAELEVQEIRIDKQVMIRMSATTTTREVEEDGKNKVVTLEPVDIRDLFVKSLEKQSCFKNIKPGDPRSDSKNKDRKFYDIKFEVSCS